MVIRRGATDCVGDEEGQITSIKGFPWRHQMQVMMDKDAILISAQKHCLFQISHDEVVLGGMKFVLGEG